MNLLDLLESLNLLTEVSWRRSDGALTRIAGRTPQGRLRVQYQWPVSKAWVHSSETWDDEIFLRNFVPERPDRKSR